MIALTAVRNRNGELYSVTASCFLAMKGPAASELTTRKELEGTSMVGRFVSIRGICSLMDSRQEETNLTSKFKMQSPNTRG
jgi:hypothetical protein